MLVRRVAPWLPLLLLLALTRTLVQPLSDPDTFWHLRLGADIVADRSLATPDWNARGGPDWVLTQWLTEVVMAGFESWWGLPGVAVWFALTMIALVLLLVRLARQSADWLPATLAVAVAMLAGAGSLSPRPHMVSYVFLALCLWSWLSAWQSGRTPWVLIPLTWVWAMSHGMWFVGIGLSVTVILGMALDGERRRALRLLLIPVLQGVAACVTPLGLDVVRAPLAVRGISRFISEWQPTNFHLLTPMIGLALLALIVAGWARRGRPVSWVEIGLLGYALVWAVWSMRTLTVAAIIACPLFASVIQDLIGDLRAPWRGRMWLRLGAYAAVILALVAITVPRTADEVGRVPDGLADELQALPAGTLVVNDYLVGGWMRWRAPEVSPLIDGLSEAYSVDQFLAYGRLVGLQPGWEEELAETGASYALLPDDSEFGEQLETTLGWTPIAEDDGYVLWQAPR